LLDSLGGRERRAIVRRCATMVACLVTAVGVSTRGGSEPAASAHESSATADAAHQVVLELQRPAAGAEICFFDSVDVDVNGCVSLDVADRGVEPADLEVLAKTRVYGCFVRAKDEQDGEAICGDTVFVRGAALRQALMTDYGAPTAAGAGEFAAAQSGPSAHNYPNPFNPKDEDTKIVFQPGGSGSICMLIYDLFGYLVYQENGLDAGDLSWDGRNGRGELVASGGYICILKIDDKVVSKHKIAVVK